MRVDRFTLATFTFDAVAPDGVVDSELSLTSEIVIGDGFASIAKVDLGGDAAYDSNHCFVFKTEAANYTPGKLSFKGSLSAPNEDNKKTFGHGILFTEIK